MVTMTFNGVSKSYFRVAKGESRPASPAIDRKAYQIGNMNGVRIGRMRHGSRVLHIPFIIMFERMEDIQRIKEELAEWLIHEEAKRLTFSDEPNTIYIAHYTNGLESFTEEESVLKGTLIMTCHDGVKHDLAETETSQLDFSYSGRPTGLIIEVNFTHATQNFTLQHEQLNRTLRINWLFSAGDRLVIDTDRRKVTINGHVRMNAFDFTSRFFGLIAGRNTITRSSENNTILFRYRRKRL